MPASLPLPTAVFSPGLTSSSASRSPYHHPVIAERRRLLMCLAAAVVAFTDAAALMASDLADFVWSDADEAPRSVKQLANLHASACSSIREPRTSANEKKRNFVETVEAHVILGVDPRRGDQMVRGALTLPHGTGKTVRVAVFAEGPAAEEARAAGADVVGGDELIEVIRTGGGKLSFDKCIATPMFMPRLSKVARILGPRGLMPNPKLGSVTNDVSGAVKAAKSGRVDFKIDKTAIVHVGLGKVNFTEESLRENIGAFVHALLLAKPVGLKKTSKYVGYVKKFTLSSTMGPGFPVTIPSLSVAADHFNKVQVS